MITDEIITKRFLRINVEILITVFCVGCVNVACYKLKTCFV